eukprot:scaffold241894_cov21-Prasinocladus_malaysianus.AAC.1
MGFSPPLRAAFSCGKEGWSSMGHRDRGPGRRCSRSAQARHHDSLQSQKQYDPFGDYNANHFLRSSTSLK